MTSGKSPNLSASVLPVRWREQQPLVLRAVSEFSEWRPLCQKTLITSCPSPCQPDKAESRCRENGDGFFIKVLSAEAGVGVGDRSRDGRSQAPPGAQRRASEASTSPARGLEQNLQSWKNVTRVKKLGPLPQGSVKEAIPHASLLQMKGVPPSPWMGGRPVRAPPGLAAHSTLTTEPLSWQLPPPILSLSPATPKPVPTPCVCSHAAKMLKCLIMQFSFHTQSQGPCPVLALSHHGERCWEGWPYPPAGEGN